MPMPDKRSDQFRDAMHAAWSRAEEAEDLARQGEWDKASVLIEGAKAWAAIAGVVKA